VGHPGDVGGGVNAVARVGHTGWLEDVLADVAGVGLAAYAAHTGTLKLDAREQGGLRVAIDIPHHGSINGTGAGW